MNNVDDKVEILLAQWQTCVEMANSVSQRRDTMNNIFLTLNLSITTAIAVVREINFIILSMAGIVICILWCVFIRNYRLLNTVKFEIINELEKKLPYQPFNLEWNKLKKNKKYLDSTKLEKVLPIIFIFLYIAYTIFFSCT